MDSEKGQITLQESTAQVHEYAIKTLTNKFSLQRRSQNLHLMPMFIGTPCIPISKLFFLGFIAAHIWGPYVISIFGVLM